MTISYMDISFSYMKIFPCMKMKVLLKKLTWMRIPCMKMGGGGLSFPCKEISCHDLFMHETFRMGGTQNTYN